jgi:hypothetical protein
MSKLFQCFQRASLNRFISFKQHRLPRKTVKSLISHMQTIGYIDGDTLALWMEMMTEHNKILTRGERMNLIHSRTKMCRLRYSSIGQYMVEMQCRYLAKILDEFADFGDQVLALHRTSPDALFWELKGSILMERISWCKLCTRVMSFVKVLKLNGSRTCTWPERDLLDLAVVRAEKIFGISKIW